MRKVAVTGIGIVSAFGIGRVPFWRGLESHSSAIKELTIEPGQHLAFSQGAVLQGFVEEEHFAKRQRNDLDRFSQFALLAAREAVQDAKIEWSESRRRRSVVVMGSCIGGQGTQDLGFLELYRRNGDQVNPLSILRIMPNAAACHISMEFGITGPTYTVSTACASSSHAIGQGFGMVRSGLADIAIVGGSEAPFSYGMLKAWEALRVISPDTCRPFDTNRSGTILGEGACVLVLEAESEAQAKSKRPWAEIIGFAMNSDAKHIVRPSMEGCSDAIREALSDARLQPHDIGYINAHGTGTTTNDSTEAAAVRRVFGNRAAQLPISGTKGAHGHSLGAAGAMEAAATIFALHSGRLPPTANCSNPDLKLGLNVLTRSLPSSVEYAISNSFAFGGLNGVLVFRRAETNSYGTVHE